MNAPSASHAESVAAPVTPTRRVLIWDAPVRVFHALMILSFAGAWITAESERWRLLHVTLGYTMAGLVAFRLVWGLVGTRHARFASFVRGPGAVLRYLRALVAGRPEHHAGHNPAGAVAIVAMLALALVLTAAGWATFNEVGPGWLEELHEGAANTLMAVVGLHVAGVLIASRLHRSNLIGAMITGRREGRPDEAVRNAWRSLAALMLVAVLGFWWMQWQAAPPAGAADAGRPAAAARHADRDDD